MIVVCLEAAVEKLGYRQNILARSFVNGKTKILATVVWGIDYYDQVKSSLQVHCTRQSFLFEIPPSCEDIKTNCFVSALISTMYKRLAF
jgi:DNA-binding LacI/PurR family transcriptional regulator